MKTGNKRQEGRKKKPDWLVIGPRAVLKGSGGGGPSGGGGKGIK